MSPKQPFFPPGGGRGDPNRGGGGQRGGVSSFFDDEDSLYTGQPIQPAGQPTGQPAGQPMDQPAGRAAKGRAVYAAQDHEMPPQPVPPVAASLNTEELLSIVPEDRLRAECQKRICPACPVKKECDDANLRALADLDNAKKRLAREREEQVRFAAESVLNDILPTLDNLDLALRHSDSYKGCKDFVVGVQMTRKLLLDALAKHGLAQAGAVGDAFDPALHEAVDMVDAPDVANNHICSRLSYGYTLNGRLLRPARVMVCKKG